MDLLNMRAYIGACPVDPSIRTEPKDSLPLTVADRVQLRQVLMNLMLNGNRSRQLVAATLAVPMRAQSSFLSNS
jgi:phosphoglycerate-specific signal transduction histidine kinase